MKDRQKLMGARRKPHNLADPVDTQWPGQIKKTTTRQPTLAKSKTIWFVFCWIKIIEMINSKHTKNICSIDIKQENPKNVKIHKRIYGFECLDTHRG